MQIVNRGKEVKERVRSVWFFLLVVGTILQTALTFYLLYKQSSNETLNKVIFVLLLTYVFAFLVIVAMSFHAKKISKEAMRGFKRSQKTVKRVLTLLMLGISVVNLFVSRGSGLELTLSIIMIMYNLLLIYVDIKVAAIADKISRRRKQKQRAEKDALISAYRIGDKRQSKERTDEK